MCYFAPLGTIDGMILLVVLGVFLTMTVRGAAVMPLDDAEEELDTQNGGSLGTGNLEWSNMSRGPGGVNANLSTISHDGAKFGGETVQYNLLENSQLYKGGGRKKKRTHQKKTRR